ncbi:MAG TPA: glycosyltransferase family A protein [Stellaceae bacterium]|nr:glycosyltransferase family A protein [Stellaceae bacterium]
MHTSISVIIPNYNHARFLPHAIESALTQSLPACELIVVDDGSTDDSRKVISSYRKRLTAVYKDHGGEASALNAGYALAKGTIIVFLDSDDVLLPNALKCYSEAFRQPGLAKVHGNVTLIDADGTPLGPLTSHLHHGDLRPHVVRYGPTYLASPPTSGNAWSHAALQQIMPIPHELYRRHVDIYLYSMAALVGKIGRVKQSVAGYRVHGANTWFRSRTTPAMTIDNVNAWTATIDQVARRLALEDVAFDPRRWQYANWRYVLQCHIAKCAAEPERRLRPKDLFLSIIFSASSLWKRPGLFLLLTCLYLLSVYRATALMDRIFDRILRHRGQTLVRRRLRAHGGLSPS